MVETRQLYQSLLQIKFNIPAILLVHYVCGIHHIQSKTILYLYYTCLYEALESGMYDVIKKSLKRSYATRSGKGNQPLNIKTAVQRPILKLGLLNFKWSFYFISLLGVYLLFMASHMPLSRASYLIYSKGLITHPSPIL